MNNKHFVDILFHLQTLDMQDCGDILISQKLHGESKFLTLVYIVSNQCADRWVREHHFSLVTGPISMAM